MTEPVDGLYEKPWPLPAIEDCAFYHSIDLPRIGSIEGEWDLRACIDDYLGATPFDGRRVIDVGTAGGYLSFAMERAGAEVVSFDLGADVAWDVVPGAPREAETRTTPMPQPRIEAMKQAYWYSHHHLGSRAQVCYGTVYDLPLELGLFDIAVLGTILTHLRDPIAALASAGRIARTLIVSQPMMRTEEPNLRLVPRGDDPGTWRSWYVPSEGATKQMLGVVGFEVERVVRCEPVRVGAGRRISSAVVAHRRDR